MAMQLVFKRSLLQAAESSISSWLHNVMNCRVGMHTAWLGHYQPLRQSIVLQAMETASTAPSLLAYLKS